MTRLPAYAKALLARRAAGERIGLLIVAVSDWKACEALALRDNTARVVVPEDTDPEGLDWSCATGLDCLVCGDDDEARLTSVTVELSNVGAASLWWECEDGVGPVVVVPLSNGKFRVYGDGDLCPVERFGKYLAKYRELNILLRDGAFYANPAFDVVRQARLDEVVAAIESDRQREASAA